jgi:hypothetical protein
MFHDGAPFNTFMAQLYAAKCKRLPKRISERKNNDTRLFFACDHMDVGVLIRLYARSGGVLTARDAYVSARHDANLRHDPLSKGVGQHAVRPQGLTSARYPADPRMGFSLDQNDPRPSAPR